MPCGVCVRAYPSKRCVAVDSLSTSRPKLNHYGNAHCVATLNPLLTLAPTDGDVHALGPGEEKTASTSIDAALGL